MLIVFRPAADQCEGHRAAVAQLTTECPPWRILSPMALQQPRAIPGPSGCVGEVTCAQQLMPWLDGGQLQSTTAGTACWRQGQDRQEQSDDREGNNNSTT
jgi:hypothetical protein